MSRSIIQYQDLQEGFLRGLANEVINLKDAYAALIDMLSLGKENVYPKVKDVLDDFKKEVNNSDFNGVVKDPSWIKGVATTALWRPYIFLHDQTFDTAFTRGHRTGVDPTPNVDTNMHVREKTMEYLNTLNSKNDVIKIIDKYLERVKKVSDYCEKNPANTGMRGFLRFGIYGLRDLTITLRRIIIYHAA